MNDTRTTPTGSLLPDPGAEAERLAGRPLDREMRLGVPHFKPGQHHATIPVETAQDFFDPNVRGTVGRVTYVDQMGHLCVVLVWRDEGSTDWRPTWVSRHGMMTGTRPVRAPESFVLSEKMLAALAEAANG